MIEVTDEMIIAGRQALNSDRNRPTDALEAAYRAMRAVEPRPKRSEVHLQRMCDVDVNAGWDAKAPANPLEGAAGLMFNDPAMAEMDRRLTALETKLVPDLQAMVDANGGTFTQRKLQRRLDALTALVLLMVGGYQPRNGREHEELKRLLAELEPTP